MSEINVGVLSGRIGADPELNYSSNGLPILRLLVVHNEYRKRGEKFEEKAHWVRFTMFGEAAERTAANLNKGDRVVVEYRLSMNSYTDKDGKKRTSFEPVVNRIMSVPAGGSGSKEASSSKDSDFPF